MPDDEQAAESRSLIVGNNRVGIISIDSIGGRNIANRGLLLVQRENLKLKNIATTIIAPSLRRLLERPTDEDTMFEQFEYALSILDVGGRNPEAGEIVTAAVECIKYLAATSADGFYAGMAVLNYHMGWRGFPLDSERAVYWAKIAVDKGHHSEGILVYAYSLGRGVAVDHWIAMHYAQMSVNNGSEDDLYYLAIGYLDGRGAARDSVKAHAYLSLSKRLRDFRYINEGNPVALALLEKEMSDLGLAQSQLLQKIFIDKYNSGRTHRRIE